MKNQFRKSICSAGLLLLFSGISVSLSSQEINLAYNYSGGKPVSYLYTSAVAQIMDMQGQTMQTDVISAFGCSVKSAGMQGSNLVLEITADTLGQTTNSPMGGGGVSVADIKGKSCKIVLSPEGKVIDLSEAVAIKFVQGEGAESDLSQTLYDFFPKMPEKPVKPGDNWNTTDSSTLKTATMTQTTITNTINKLEGIETIDGVECAKILKEGTGTFVMSLQAQGMDINIGGPFTRTSECLVAVKEGHLVSQTSSMKVTGDLDIASMGMTMPITIQIKDATKIN
ncbi:MAG: hypothetical protein WAW07_11530 [Bacteroidales bacterium]